MFITAGVTEGEQYKVSDVKVTGDTVLPQEQVEKMVLVKPGQIFSRRLLELQLRRDRRHARQHRLRLRAGQSDPGHRPRRQDRRASTSQVVPGPRVNVRRIVFKGNARTADEVLRREMRQFEGAGTRRPRSTAPRSACSAWATSRPSKSRPPPVAGTDDQVDVVFNVKETHFRQLRVRPGLFAVERLSRPDPAVARTTSSAAATGFGRRRSSSNYQQRYDFSFFNPYFTDNGCRSATTCGGASSTTPTSVPRNTSTNSGAAQVVLGLPITENDTVSALFGIDTNEILPSPDRRRSRSSTTSTHWKSHLPCLARGLGWARDTRNDLPDAVRAAC